MMANDSSVLPEGALRLRDAIRKFVPSTLLEEYQSAKKARAQFPRRLEFVSPYMRGPEEPAAANRPAEGALRADKKLKKLWIRIKSTLVQRLLAGELIASVQKDPPFGPWQRIPADAWDRLWIKNTQSGQVGDQNIDLFDVRIAERSLTAPAPTTGVLGRPSSMHLIEAEFERRRADNLLETHIAWEARTLAAWFNTTYSDDDPVSPKTISNRLGARFREAKAQRA